MTSEDEAVLRVSLELIGRDPHILDYFTESERRKIANDLNKIWDDILVKGGHLTSNERLYVADILINGYMSVEEFCEFPLQKRREIMDCIFDFINKNEKKLCGFLRGGKGE